MKAVCRKPPWASNRKHISFLGDGKHPLCVFANILNILLTADAPPSKKKRGVDQEGHLHSNCFHLTYESYFVLIFHFHGFVGMPEKGAELYARGDMKNVRLCSVKKHYFNNSQVFIKVCSATKKSLSPKKIILQVVITLPLFNPDIQSKSQFTFSKFKR